MIIVAATLAGGIFGSRAFTRQSDATGAQGVESAYTEALSVIADNYVEPIDYAKANEAAVQGMLWTLDPHSNYFNPEEYQRLMQDQESRFSGIGVSILRHRDGVYVQTPIDGTPAAQAGLRFGDRIIEVDGKDARDWTTPEVSKAVRGPEGQPVTIKVERAGSQAPLFFTIKRGNVPQPSIRNAFMIRPGVGYIGLTGGFTQTTADELASALKQLDSVERAIQRGQLDDAHRQLVALDKSLDHIGYLSADPSQVTRVVPSLRRVFTSCRVSCLPTAGGRTLSASSRASLRAWRP